MLTRAEKTCNAGDLRISSGDMKKSMIVVLFFAIVAFARQSAAQQTHKEYEPPAAAGAGQKLLAQFAGDWDMVKTFFPASGQPAVTKGTCKQYMIQGGKFLQSDFTFFDPDGSKSTGTGISGFDPKTNRFTTVWYDSQKMTMSIRQSDGTFDGTNIVLVATASAHRVAAFAAADFLMDYLKSEAPFWKRNRRREAAPGDADWVAPKACDEAALDRWR